MHRRLAFALKSAICAAGLMYTASVHAQSVGLTVGTTGVGVEAGYDIGEMFGVRATGNFLPISHSITPSNITYDGDLRLLTLGLLGDAYLFNAGFRLTAGAFYDRNRLNITGTPNGAVTVGNTSYSPGQLGTLSGRVDFREVAPYAGLGYASNRGGHGWAFTADAGVMFAGAPRVTLASNGPATLIPGFAANLETERQKIENDIDWLRYTPMVRLGVLYRF